MLTWGCKCSQHLLPFHLTDTNTLQLICCLYFLFSQSLMRAATRGKEMSTAEQVYKKHHHCQHPKEQSLLREASRLNSKRLKQYGQARRKHVHALSSSPKDSAAVSWPCGQNSFIWTDKYPCNYSSSHTSNGWLIQSDCPWSAFEGSPLYQAKQAVIG